MFAFILIGYSVFHLSESNDILSTLWDKDVDKALRGKSLSSSEANTMIRRLSQVPFTEILKHDACTKLSLENRMEKFNPQEWMKFESLIPYLPVSVLEKLNVTDKSIMSYFGQMKLTKPQLTKLAEHILLHNPNVLEDEEKLHTMGNIICGFNPKDIQTIKEPVLRSLINKNFFRRIKSCNVEQLRHLLETVEKYTVLGPPRTWHPSTVKRAGILISGMTVPRIREIPERSFSQITPEVIESTPVEVLKCVRNGQLKTLSRHALLSWRRKTQDLRPLYESSGSSLEISLSSALSVILFNSLHFSFI